MTNTLYHLFELARALCDHARAPMALLSLKQLEWVRDLEKPFTQKVKRRNQQKDIDAVSEKLFR